MMRKLLVLYGVGSLAGCTIYGAPTEQLIGPLATRLGIWYGAPILQEETYQALHGGDPSKCANSTIANMDLDCAAGREAMARSVAIGKQADPRYALLADQVTRCDAGKIPNPPATEKDCPIFRDLKADIDKRVTELRASGKV